MIQIVQHACEHQKSEPQPQPGLNNLAHWVINLLLATGLVGYSSILRGGTPPDPLPLGRPFQFRILYRHKQLWTIPASGHAAVDGPSGASGGPASGPAGIDQVAVASFDSTHNALRVNALLTSGGVHTPTDANQVFTSIYDPVHNAIQINCVLGCGGGGGGSFTAAGDLAGSASTQTVIGLQTRPVAATAPTANQVLAWSGSAWTPTTLASAGAQIAGDLGGTLAMPTVVGLQTRPVAPTAPTPNQVLAWNGSAWSPATPTSGGAQIAGDLSGTLASPTVVGLQTRPVAATAPTANQVLAWNGSAWSPATPTSGGAQIAGDLGGTLSSPAVVGLQRVPISSGAPSSGQCLVYNGTNWGAGSCSSGSGAALLAPATSQTIQPTAGNNIIPLAIAPATGTTQTADLFDVWKDPAMTTKAIWVDASGALNFAGNNATYGTTGQSTQSFLRLYGSTTSSNLAPPYLDLEKEDGSVKAYLAPSTSTNGLLCTSSGVPGGDCGPTIASTSFLVSAAGGTAPATSDCVKWISSTQIGDTGSACGAGGGAVIQVNGTNTASASPINFQSGANITVSNPSAGNVAFNLTGTVPVANGGTGLTTVGASGQCLTSNGTVLAWAACGSGGGGGASLTPTASQTIQPTAGSNITPLAIAPATGTTQTADLFDVWKDSAMTTKAIWVDASGALNFAGNNATYGTTGQSTQSFLRLYGSTTSSNLAPPYLDLEKEDGSVKAYLAPSTSTNGLLCTSSGVPGGDCGPTIASTSFLVSAAGGTAPTTSDCVKWISSTQVGDSGSACGGGSSLGVIFSEGAGGNTVSSGTIYFPVSGVSGGAPGEYNVPSVIPVSCTAHNAYAVTDNANGASTLTITLRNGATLAALANTSLKMTFNANQAAGVASDTTDTVSLSAGTLIDWGATMGGSGLTSAQIQGIGFQCN